MKENHFFWNKIKKKYYPCLDFVVHLAYFIVFEVYVAAFYRRSQGWTELLRKTWSARPFSRQNSNLLLDQFNKLKKQIHRYHKLSDPPPPTPQIKKSMVMPVSGLCSCGRCHFQTGTKRVSREFKNLRRQLQRKRHIKIGLCVTLSMANLLSRTNVLSSNSHKVVCLN